MDQQQLSDRLEERVADHPVGAAPVDAIRAAVRRRRGRAAVLGAVAAVAVLTAGGVVWQAADPDPQPPVASDPSAPDPDLPPDGYGYVGIGAAVIAAPGYWNHNAVECGTPVEDTVIIDPGVSCLMDVPRPADVESIEVRTSPMPDTADVWTPFEVDGEPALRSPVLSTSGTETVTSASVYLPERRVLFVAESSSADAAAWVERELDSIVILEGYTTVPGFNDLTNDTDEAPAEDTYLQRLQALGLTVEVEEMRSALEPGTVLTTLPAVGAVVAPGDTVRVVVAR